MNEDEIRSLLQYAAPAERPSTPADLAELLSRGRRKRKVRGYLVVAGSAAGTATAAVLIVAFAVGRSAGGQHVVPANQPAGPPMTSSTTEDLRPSPTTSQTGSDSSGLTSPNTPATRTSPGHSSSTTGTTPTYPTGATSTP